MAPSLNEVHEIVSKAFSNLKKELNVVVEQEIEGSTNILDILDSIDVVNLIMETESLVEDRYGVYVPLANEESFDANLSPLLSVSNWEEHVLAMIKENYG
tara:strand:- start:433 stop:732 length:300 start_codon:yes stop_codon:yes gene_type:complete